MKKIFIIASLSFLVGCSNVNIILKKADQIPSQTESENITEITKKYKNIIMFIGDGMGPNHVDAGGIYLGEPLCFDVTDENWTYHAYSNTDSLTSKGFSLDTSKSLLRPDLNSSLYDGMPSPYGDSNLGTSGNITTYTDSAAGGTALATGVKVTNSRIGQDINGKPIENLVEIASGLGKKTGVVTSDNIVGATPSSFLVHVDERHLEDEIIKGVAVSKADLVLTQNVDSFRKNKTSYETMFKQNGYEIAYTKSQLNPKAEKQIGLFDYVAPKPDPRVPSLEDLTAYALDYLDNDEGFFLMVEGSNIDKKSHSNDTKLMLNELIGFNDAVKSATEWAESRKDTLIVVTADHETGGLFYDRETSTKENIISNIGWKTYNHSRTRVDIAIYGDISEYIEIYGDEIGKVEDLPDTLEGLPYWDNTDVFRLCSTYLNS